MKTLVTYFSQTGKTRLVAETIFGAVAGDKEIKEFDQVSGLDGYDLAFIGFPIIALARPSRERIFLRNLPSGEKWPCSLPTPHRKDRRGLTNGWTNAGRRPAGPIW